MVTSISTAFYDSLFGIHLGNTSINSLEVEALKNVKKKLSDPKQLRECIPSLPTILLGLLVNPKELGASFKNLVNIIEKAPSLAIRILK
ncbi:MAG: hypothetical protein HRT54_24125 [Colwellia sp.]|nr:hypothetical protein [Colwellia sp.]